MTYVAFTSFFAGTGGMLEVAMVVMGVFVACTGAPFGGDFLRLKSFMLLI